MLLERAAQPGDDLDRVLDRRFVDVDLLEPAEKRAVLFEMVPELLVGGRADAADRPRGERGLEEVGRVHRPARRGAGTDHGVNFIDKQDRVRKLLELVDDRLQPLLEVAAVARAGEQRAHVERVDHRRLQHLGHITLDDLAGEPFGDCGFADAGVADIERIVLRAAAEDLHRAVDLGHPADQRIDLSGLGLLVEVDGELLERRLFLAAFLLGLLLGPFRSAGLGRSIPLADAVADVGHGIETAHVLLLQEIDGVALALGEQGDEDVGAGDVVAAR